MNSVDYDFSLTPRDIYRLNLAFVILTQVITCFQRINTVQHNLYDISYTISVQSPYVTPSITVQKPVMIDWNRFEQINSWYLD